jgi:DNA-binding CsgD family transcriptional regulator
VSALSTVARLRSVTAYPDDGCVSAQTSARGPLVGRTEDLARLARTIGLGPGDVPGGAVVLAGDAGVGKTRLLTELAREAREAGWRVVAGHCLDLGESSLPYLPFTEIFGRLGADEPDVADALTDDAPALARLMPGRRQLGSGDQDAGRMDRAQLVDAVQAALRRLSDSAPLLVVVEDVHWADHSTRELLSFLFARPVTGIAVVASYRSDDLHRRHPLRASVAEWTRLPEVTRLVVAPLADDDVRALVRALHTEPLSEGDYRDIVERAEGNAFFAEELVAAGPLNGRMLSADLADLLLVRIDQLEESTRLVVRAASVAGRRVSHDLLFRVAGLPGDQLEIALRGAVDGGVLVAVRPDGYAFRHALLAEAVYGDLLPGERVRLHAAYARIIAGGEVEGTAAELARHARFGHDLPTAIRAGIQAGDEAMDVGGTDEAAHHYEHVLELLGDPGAASLVDEVDVVALSVKAGEAAAAAGRVHRAVGLLEEQLLALPVDCPADERARLLVALATTSLLGDNVVDALRLTTQALPLVPADPPSALRAGLAAVHARALAERSRPDEAATWAEEAAELGRRLGLADVLADATTTLAHLARRAGDPEASLRTLRENVEAARSACEVPAELRSLFSIGAVEYELGHLPQARAAYEAAAARARETGRPWAPYGLDARIMTGVVAYVAGDWDGALATVDVTHESTPGLAEAALAAVGLQVKVARGGSNAPVLLPVLREWWDRDGLVAILCASAAIDLHGYSGDIAAATEAHEHVTATITRLWELPTFQAQIRLCALMLGQLAAEAGRVGAEARIALAERGPDLVATAEHAAAAHGASGTAKRGPEGEAWLLRLAAEAARLRWMCGVEPPSAEDLVDVWARTVAAFEAFGHAYETARSRARYAAVLRAAGQASEASRQAALAREVARALGAGPLLAELTSLALGGRGRPAPADRLDGALTARELEVLALVALGRSNREIGQQLFISTKTASVHVSNILAKLGASGRTEAVALARRRGDLPA